MGEVVPEHIRILQVSLGVTLLSMNEMREFGGITNEENRCVVEDPVEVTFLCPNFNGEATGITSGVGRPRLATDSGETDSGSSTGTDFLEESGAGEITNVVGHFEVTVGTSALGVDNTLGNSLAVEMGKEVDVMEICCVEVDSDDE